MKATIIRGVKLRPGSLVYYIKNDHPDYATLAVQYDGEGEYPDLHLPKIVDCAISATNGETFAFARKGSKDSGPWYWVKDARKYFVSRDEAEAALTEAKKRIVVRAKQAVIDARNAAKEMLDSAFELEAKIPAFQQRHGIASEREMREYVEIRMMLARQMRAWYDRKSHEMSSLEDNLARSLADTKAAAK